jgi:asparagine synthase (glutamine-hydrolysing)
MCGIAGILLPSGRVVDPGVLERMAGTLLHRGPDNTGWHVAGSAGFAHTRLSIVDLSARGNQPFRNDRYVLTYNGEIYNHLELRKNLKAEGVVLPDGSSDTDTLFHYLIRFGVDRTLRDIRGMYAFSFADTSDGAVYLCRDRYGIKPLYWTFRGGVLYWASEVKAIRQAVDVEVNFTRTLFAAVAGTENSVYLTPFEGVFNVKPGRYLSCRPGREPVSCEYYNLIADVDEKYYRELDRLSGNQVIGRFDAVFADAVKSMLMGDAPMGCFVSGGIDSSLVSTLAIENYKELSLFTANILGRFSEFADAQVLSESLKQPLYDAPFAPGMLLEGWARATWHSEIPLVAHVNSIPFSYVACLARQRGVKAVLTGEGSDELFLGYPKLLARRWKPLAAFPLKALRSLYGLVPKLEAYVFPNSGPSIEAFLFHLVRQYEREFIDADASRAYPFLPPAQAAEHYLTIQMFRSSLHSLLHRNDRMGMLASIESRFPFLDEEVVRFAVNLPVRFKIGRSVQFHNIKHPFAVDKWIVREAARRRLPKRLVDKPKLGFPLYGHRHLLLKKGFFRGGFIEQGLGMTDRVEEHLLTRDRYNVGKLASIEVFGRLFAMGQSQADVSSLLDNFSSIEI